VSRRVVVEGAVAARFMFNQACASSSYSSIETVPSVVAAFRNILRSDVYAFTVFGLWALPIHQLRYCSIVSRVRVVALIVSIFSFLVSSLYDG
jgi:hypothetical protein